MTTAGEEMHTLVERLYPLCDITGDGVRATLEIVGAYLPLQVHEVPTGTQVLDWTVPQMEHPGRVRRRSAGNRVVDFAASSLHVLGYSVPVSATMPLAELRGHLHTLPDHRPGCRTAPATTGRMGVLPGPGDLGRAAGRRVRGAHRLPSKFADGHLTYAEHVVPGQVADEVIVSCHVCHPSLANDNLAGIAVATFLARALAEQKPYYTYRFLFAPGTIGAITWLARNAERIKRVDRAGAGLRRRLGPADVQTEQTR